MKRIISLVMAAILVLSVSALAGCGSDKGSSDTSASQNADGKGDQNSASTAENEGKGEVADGLEVIAEPYHASEYLGKVLLIVTNNTGKVIELRANADFFDESGALLNSDDDFEGDIAPGSTVCMGGLLSDGDFTDYTYQVTYTVNEYSTNSVDQDLTMEYEHDDEKVTVSITNHGELPASSVGYRPMRTAALAPTTKVRSSPALPVQVRQCITATMTKALTMLKCIFTA